MRNGLLIRPVGGLVAVVVALAAMLVVDDVVDPRIDLRDCNTGFTLTASSAEVPKRQPFKNSIHEEKIFSNLW